MPTRRLVVALSVLLLGVFGIGIVTAIGRSGDDGKPRAQPTQSPGVTQPPPTTTGPTPSAEPTAEPTQSPTPAPTTPPPDGVPGDTDGDGDVDGNDTGNDGSGDPNMPNTGAPLALALLATATLAAAGGARRLAQ